MPNWCFTNVAIHDDEGKIDTLFDEFSKALSIKSGSDFGTGWLGNLLMHIGYSEDDASYGQVRCRGTVLSAEKVDKNEINLQTESAWSPHLECVRLFVEKYSDTAEIIYSAEEPGLELYCTNDPLLVGKYVVDKFFDVEPDVDLYFDYECSKEEIEERLVSLFRDVSGFDNLCKKASEYVESFSEYNYIYFHEYEYVPLDNLG